MDIDSSRPGSLLIELIDRAVQRDELEHLWETHYFFPKLRQTPAAIGTAVYDPPATAIKQ